MKYRVVDVVDKVVESLDRFFFYHFPQPQLQRPEISTPGRSGTTTRLLQPSSQSFFGAVIWPMLFDRLTRLLHSRRSSVSNAVIWPMLSGRLAKLLLSPRLRCFSAIIWPTLSGRPNKLLQLRLSSFSAVSSPTQLGISFATADHSFSLSHLLAPLHVGCQRFDHSRHIILRVSLIGPGLRCARE